MSKSAIVYTNDPVKEKQQIRLEGKVKEVFAADPKDIFTVFTQPGKAFDQTIVLTNNLDQPVVITGMKHTLGTIAKVEYKTVEKGRKYEVNLSGKIDKPMAKGGLIRFDLLDAPIKILKLRAFINVRPSAPKGKKGKKEPRKKEDDKQPS